MPDNLPELRDIHIEDGVSAWPLGYGWWVIIAGILALWGLVLLAVYLRRKSKKLYALHLIKGINDADIVAAAAQISEILRRICVYKYPQAVALNGAEWQQFLMQHCKKTLSTAAFNLLINSPYMPTQNHNYNHDDLEALRNFSLAWIGENL